MICKCVFVSSRVSADAALDGDGRQSDNVLQYERKLLSLEARSLRRHTAKRGRRRGAGSFHSWLCRVASFLPLLVIANVVLIFVGQSLLYGKRVQAFIQGYNI